MYNITQSSKSPVYVESIITFTHTRRPAVPMDCHTLAVSKTSDSYFREIQFIMTEYSMTAIVKGGPHFATNESQVGTKTSLN